MGNLRRWTTLAALALAVAFSTGLVQGQSGQGFSDRAKQVGAKMMCMCGSCNDTAASCSHPGGNFSGPCDYAKREMQEVESGISRGDSDATILQAAVREYGDRVLAEPPAHGFNALAYAIPGILFALGMVLVVVVIRHWRRPEPIAAATAAGPHATPEMLERARREIDRETDD